MHAINLTLYLINSKSLTTECVISEKPKKETTVAGTAPEMGEMNY